MKESDYDFLLTRMLEIAREPEETKRVTQTEHVVSQLSLPLDRYAVQVKKNYCRYCLIYHEHSYGTLYPCKHSLCSEDLSKSHLETMQEHAGYKKCPFCNKIATHMRLSPEYGELLGTAEAIVRF